MDLIAEAADTDMWSHPTWIWESWKVQPGIIQLLEYPIPPRPRPRHKNPDPRVFNGSRKPSNIIDPLVSKRLEKI